MEMNFDVANDSLVHWHEAMEAKFHDSGKKYAGEDFDKMLWRYDVCSSISSIIFGTDQTSKGDD